MFCVLISLDWSCSWRYFSCSEECKTETHCDAGLV